MSARDALINYLKAKVDESDWHAVSDAANDLRVLEARGFPDFNTAIEKETVLIPTVDEHLRRVSGKTKRLSGAW